MPPPLRYGILGTGMMGLEHIRNLDLLESARVTAIADPDAGSRHGAMQLLRDLAKQQPRRPGSEPPHAGVLEFESAGELASCREVDAVVIASPNCTHKDVLQPFWGTGKHLLVEKPLATTLEDCAEVEQRAAAHAGVVWTAMEYRYMPPVARLIERVHHGDVGTPRMISIREHRFPFLRKVGDWNRFSRNTGGTLVEKCCHFFDLMLLLARSEPLRVFASGGQDVNHLNERYPTPEHPEGEVPDILDNAFVLVDFASGLRASLDLCMFAEASRNEQEISVVGDQAKIESLVPESVVRYGRREDFRFGQPPAEAVNEEHFPVAPELLAAGHHHGSTFFQHQRFLAACRGKCEAEVTARDGARAVALGVVAQRSIEEGQVVEWSEVGGRE